VDAEKVPWITEAQAAPFKFNFQDEAYSSESSSANHLLSHHFRKNWHEEGLVVGPFSDFVDREEQEKLKIAVGESSEWAPSATGGVWKALGEAATLPDFRKQTKKNIYTVFSDESKKESRFNPNFTVIGEFVDELKGISDARPIYDAVCFAFSRAVCFGLETLSIVVNAGTLGG
jgi:hypothetical protein